MMMRPRRLPSASMSMKTRGSADIFGDFFCCPTDVEAKPRCWRRCADAAADQQLTEEGWRRIADETIMATAAPGKGARIAVPTNIDMFASTLDKGKCSVRRRTNVCPHVVDSIEVAGTREAVRVTFPRGPNAALDDGGLGNGGEGGPAERFTAQSHP